MNLDFRLRRFPEGAEFIRNCPGIGGFAVAVGEVRTRKVVEERFYPSSVDIGLIELNIKFWNDHSAVLIDLLTTRGTRRYGPSFCGFLTGKFFWTVAVTQPLGHEPLENTREGHPAALTGLRGEGFREITIKQSGVQAFLGHDDMLEPCSYEFKPSATM